MLSMRAAHPAGSSLDNGSKQVAELERRGSYNHHDGDSCQAGRAADPVKSRDGDRDGGRRNKHKDLVAQAKQSSSDNAEENEFRHHGALFVRVLALSQGDVGEHQDQPHDQEKRPLGLRLPDAA